MSEEPNWHRDLRRAVENDDLGQASSILQQVPSAPQTLNRHAPWYQPPLLGTARSVPMAELLLDSGAYATVVGNWWSEGFAAYRVKPDVARMLIDHGADISIHAAAAIGLQEHVDRLLQEDPKAIEARGGDGGTPLHFARSEGIAKALIKAGAALEAQDDDHSSTPSQWLIGEAPEITRFLLDEGAEADIFMAAALGDFELAERIIESDSEATGYRIGNDEGPFPGIGHQGRGGTIYQWSLGFNRTPHQVASERGHHDVFELLLKHSTPKTRLVVNALMADRKQAETLVEQEPGLVERLGHADHQLLAKYCWETNKDIDAVRLMLDLGWPIGVAETNHGFAALHNAAWCGDPHLVGLLLERGHPTGLRDPNHKSTAIGWALHSCLVEKRHPDGDFSAVLKLLAGAGVPFDPVSLPTGNEELDRVLASLDPT